MKLPLILIALCGLLTIASANDQMRKWTLVSGETKEAEILAYNEAEKRVTLRLADQSEVKFNEQEFSPIDRAWILEWVERYEFAKTSLPKYGGTLTEHKGTGKFEIGYAVYHPRATTDGTKLPMLILFHPGGNGRRSIYQYIEAASAVGITVVSLDYFRNTDNDPKKEAEMLECFTELLPQIEATVPHDEKRMFMGGLSGGGWRAYHYSAQVKRPWAGIMSTCGWLGGKQYYDLDYPRMRVAMVNGDKDLPAHRWIARDSEILHKNGSVISVHAFEGGHQIAPPSVQEKALRWLLSDEGEQLAEAVQ